MAAVVGAHLTLPALILCFVGVAGLGLLRVHRLDLPWLLGAWALASPLIWIASRIAPRMSDEFSHWLPNARFLVEYDKFPDLVDTNRWSAAPGYPPALVMVSYGVQRLGASGFEAAPKVFNAMLAGSFGLMLARLIQPASSRLLALAAGVAAATVLNPFFDPRVALATYTDVPSGFVLAMSLAACWRAADEPDARSWWRIAAPAVLLVLLRETNIVLAGGLGLGLLLLGRRGWGPLAVHASSMGTFLLWRLYLISIAQRPTISVRRFLVWTYIAVFASYQVETANSTWRFISQLGPSFVYLCAALLLCGRTRPSVPAKRGGYRRGVAGSRIPPDDVDALALRLRLS